MPFGNRKKYSRCSFQFSIARIKKYHPLFKHFSKLKIAFISMEKIVSISLKLDFTPNTLGG